MMINSYSLITILVIALLSVTANAQTGSVRAGESVQLYQVSDSQIQSAVMFYRLQGSRQFMRQNLSHKDGRWLAQLDATQVQAPEVEYYFQFIMQDGSTRTEPVKYPQYNPLRLLVEARQKPLILMADETVSPDQRQIEFQVNGDVGDVVRVYIDDMDVTDFVTRDNDRWVLDNEAGLFSGQVILKVTTYEGELLASHALDFTEPDASVRVAGERELVLRGNASLNIGGQSDTNNTGSLSITGNLHAETEYKQGDFRSHFSGVNVNYQRGADPQFNLSSGFLLTNTYQEHSLQFGDVSVDGTPLVMSGFSRRGLLYKNVNDHRSGSVFSVRTSPVEGWESGISFDDRQTYGVSWKQDIGDRNRSSIKLAMVSGKLLNPQTGNVGSSQVQPQAGDTAGLQFDTEVAGMKISAQFASSKFDADTSDATRARYDNAYEMKIQQTIYGLASSVGFHRYGSNYATIANPNFSNDRQGLDVSIGSQLQSLGWTASFASTRDNIQDDVSRPVVLSSNGGVNLSLLIEDWPSVTMGFNISEQSSRKEPTPADRVSNTGQDISLGISDRFAPFNVNWSSSLGRLRNDLDATKDSDTQNHSLSVDYSDEAVRVNLNLSQNRSRSQVTLVSNLLNMAADFPVFSDDLVLNSQLSYQQNMADDNSQNNTVIGGSARIAWRARDMFGSLGGVWGDARLSLNWTFNRTTDEINPANDVSDQRLLLEFSMGKPLQFDNRWQF